MKNTRDSSQRDLHDWVRSLAPRPGVYVIENTVTGARYVGKAKCLPQRLQDEISQLEAGAHHSALLQADWRQYQPESFAVSVSYSASERAAIKEEIWLAMAAQAYEDSGGYTQRTAQNCIAASFRERERKLMRSRSRKYVLLSKVDLRARIPKILLETFCKKERPLIESWDPLLGYFGSDERRDFASWCAEATHYHPGRREPLGLSAGGH